jgi:mRNA interferase RelE/StbE
LEVKILQSPTFKKQYNKLDQPILKKTDDVIKSIIDSPEEGQQKKGDLSGVYVWKFKFKTQLFLLAYTFDAKTRELRAIGVHQNFYQNF